jgi:hypothetical protein
LIDTACTVPFPTLGKIQPLFVQRLARHAGAFAKAEIPGTIRGVVDPSDRSYFFDEGVRFSCTRCGKCCTGKPGVVRVTPEEVHAIAAKVHVADKDFLERFTRPIDGGFSLNEKPDGSCVFYDEAKGCTVHAARPMQCRLYPFWFRYLRSEAAWAEAARECPGIGHGDLHTKEEILMLLQQGIDQGLGLDREPEPAGSA